MRRLRYSIVASKHAYGFTIVELLVVIVILAVLSTVTIVVYGGVTARAYDSVVQSDLARFAKQIELAAADTGVYPKGGGIRWTPTTWPDSSDSTIFPGFTYRASKQAYETNLFRNLFYCEGNIGGVRAYRITAKSKSGKVFYYGSTNGMVNRSEGITIDDQADVCTGFDYPITWAYGYYGPEQRWWSWVSE